MIDTLLQKLTQLGYVAEVSGTLSNGQTTLLVKKVGEPDSSSMLAVSPDQDWTDQELDWLEYKLSQVQV